MRILHIVTYIDGGGVASVVYNYSKYMDRTNLDLHIIALDLGYRQFSEKAFKELGFTVHYVPHSMLKRIPAILSIIKQGCFDIVHAHCEFLSELYLIFAKIAGVKVRIMHSHNANPRVSLMKRMYRPIGRLLAKTFATSFFGCGKDAAISMWGQKSFDNGKCYILNNAIDTSRFAFSQEKRVRIRKELLLNDSNVFVNVGRLDFQKNQTFLLDIFHDYRKHDNKAKLVFVGDGVLKESLVKYVENLGLSDSVLFLGNRQDVNEILNACDCFLLPSLFEGLPVVAIESQANGLPIIMADTITKECGITDVAFFIPINIAVDHWCEKMKEVICLNKKRDDYCVRVRNVNFDITIEAPKLLEYYKQLLLS